MPPASVFGEAGVWAGKTPAIAGWLLIPSVAGTCRSHELTPHPQDQPVSGSESFTKPPLPCAWSRLPSAALPPSALPLTVQANSIFSQRLLSFKPGCQRPGQPTLANCDPSISTSYFSFQRRGVEAVILEEQQQLKQRLRGQDGQKVSKALTFNINFTQRIFLSCHHRSLSSCCAQATTGPPGARKPLLTASQGEHGNMLDSKLRLGLRKRTEMKFLSPEKLSSHLVQKQS